MHIPKGADISQKSRQISYDLCRQTFGKGHLVCDSWLLFPEHKHMLDKNDNIISLMSDFDIISQSTTNNYNELFHIFGNNADFSDISNLATKSRLQRAYIQRIQKALPVGSAVGIKNI